MSLALGLSACDSLASSGDPQGHLSVGSPSFGAAGTSPLPVAPVSLAPGISPPTPQPPGLSRPVESLEAAPPPISGGTLLATRDRGLLVASDPDRDQIYFVDAVSRSLLHTRKLSPHDEPGRLVEDAAGRIHVALRGGRAVVSMYRDAETPIVRREVCDLPRGLAYDAARDSLQVACAEGKLVTLAAAPDAGVTRVVELWRDARDVFLRDDEVFVTRFRSAELVRITADGKPLERFVPPSFLESQIVFPPASSDGTVAPGSVKDFETTPTTAWRAIDVPGKGSVILHQRARTAEVQIQRGGYGGGGCGSGIVQTSITVGLGSAKVGTADVGAAALAVDVAADPAGELLALAMPGNWANGGSQVQLYRLADASLQDGESTPAFGSSNIPPFPGAASTRPGSIRCMGTEVDFPNLFGQVTAVAFISAFELAVQEREPAAITILDTRGSAQTRIALGQSSRFDTGHTMFHLRSGAGVACASCHAEGGDDSHVWTFQGIGARRTQTVRGGILGTEPLHWNGDMRDFSTLVKEVFVGRMAGFAATPEQSDALAHWIDRQPSLTSAPRDAAAAQRGKALFESAAVGCANCHGGVHLTDNRFADVGTGAVLQVPSLRGVSFRLPLMHSGCAATLRARFEPTCGGGELHGHTAQLAPNQIDDLVAYLETL